MEKRFLAVLQDLSNNVQFSSSSRKHLYTTLLDHYRRDTSNSEVGLASLSPIDWAHILQAFYFTKYTGEEGGNRSIQADIKRWFEGEAFPYLIQNVMKNEIQSKEVLTAHWILSENGKAEIPAELPEWEMKDPYTFVIKGKNIQSTLLTGVLSINGEVQGFETIIPETLTKMPEFRTLFGSQTIPARVIPLTSSGDILEYRIQHGKKNIVIRQNIEKDSCAITQKITHQGNEEEYLYQQAKGNGRLKGCSKLIERYGLWQSIKDPTKGLCIVNPNQMVIGLNLRKGVNNSVTITKATTKDGSSILQDTSHSVGDIFGFSDGSDTVIVKDKKSKNITEVNFPSKGLSLVASKEGKWVSKGLYKDFVLTEELDDAFHLFGKDFNQFLLPLSKRNNVIGTQEHKFVIWPGELQVHQGIKNDDLLASKIKALTHTTCDENIPLLSVSLKKGELGKEDAKLVGSSAAFMYLAYAMMVQGNYEQALKYLECSEKSPFIPQEKEIFTLISSRISHYPDTSKKGLALRMKSELATNKIQRVQLGQKEFDPHLWKEHLDKVKHQMSLYENYKKKFEYELSGIPSQKGVDPTFVLSQDECIEFEKSAAESIEFLIVEIDKKKVDDSSSLKDPKADHFEKLVKTDLHAFIKLVIYKLGKSTHKNSIESISSPYISKEEFLRSFAGYWDQIVKENLSANHWKVQKIKSLVFQNVVPTDLKILEAGKKILLDLAADPKKTSISQDFYKMASKLQHLGKRKPSFFNYFFRSVLEFLSVRFVFVRKILKFFNIDVDYKNFSENTVVDSFAKFLPKSLPQAIATPFDKNENTPNATSIHAIKEELKKQDSLFSTEEKLVWEKSLNLITNEVKTENDPIGLVKIITAGLKYKIHFLAMRHAAEQVKKIHTLETSLKTASMKTTSPMQEVVLNFEDPLLKTDLEWLHALEKQVFVLKDKEAITEKENYYRKLAKHVEESLTSSQGSELQEMEEEENILRKKGVNQALESRIQQLKQSHGIVHRDAVDELKSALQVKIQTSQESCQVVHQEILKLVKDNRKSIPDLDALLHKPWIYSSQDAFDKLLDLYQQQKLIGPLWKEVEQKITCYLLLATQIQQFQQGMQTLQTLDALKESDKKVAKHDTSSLEKISMEWETTSNALSQHLNAGASLKRYCDQNGKLIHPEYSKKYLVTEYRLGLVLRKDQIETVEKMLNTNLALLRPPGFGKSKAVMLPLLALLGEQGRFPVVLETEELCRIAETDLDKMNRLIFNQARHIFRFHSSHSIDPSELVDEYYRLLDAKATKGYVVTSIESLAALDNTLVRLGKDLKETYKDFCQNLKNGFDKPIDQGPELSSAMINLKTIQKQRHWLMKIRELVHSGTFVADEVDDIFDINRWVNEAIQNHEPPPRKLSRGIGYIFETILAHSGKNSELSALADALLKNQQANFNRNQFDHYSKHLAEAIYLQDTPFELHQEEWKFIKDRVNKQEFIDFVTGKPGSKLAVKWEDVHDKAPLEYIGILKHLLTSTLPTVLSEVIDLDFGLNQDGCTIEPLKKGENLPNTRHGDAYELVAYHFAYYASRVPEKSFFNREWKKIQSKITQGTASDLWCTWYQAAAVSGLPPKQQLEELYNHLEKAESWKQRLLLLSDAAMSHVRLFPYQIKCNVQDALIDEDIHLGGASGTVNFYALPPSFEKDSSVDSREVSGNIDLNLAEMHPMGLDQEIDIFNGNGTSNGKEKVLELAKDFNCKAIINQGGALEGKNSLKAVKLIRKELAKSKIKRQILFVDPKTRQQRMWDPEETQSKAFDPDKLRAHYLVYFGSPDTRGTDFPIEMGYAGFIVGKTMDEEQRQQAIMRMRKFGHGQTVKLFMHQSIQSSLNIRLGRDKNYPVTLSELMNDVKRRSLDKKAQSNWKSAVHKTQIPTLQQIKSVWFKPWIQDEDIYWTVHTENPLEEASDLKRILTGVAADVALFEVFEKSFISKREMDYRKDFEPVDYANSTEEIAHQFDQNAIKSHELSKAFQSVSSGIRVAELISEAIPAGDTLDKETLHRLEDIQSHLGNLENKIKTAKSVFLEEEKNSKIHSKNLKKSVATSQNLDSNSQEQVQQQQQQQIQNQHTAKKPKKSLEIKTKHAWNDWVTPLQGINKSTSAINHLASQNTSPILASSFPNLNEAAKILLDSGDDFGFDDNTRISVNQLVLLKKRKILEGDTMDRIAVLRSPQNAKLLFYAIDQQDQNLGFSPGIAAMNSFKKAAEINIEVHSIRSDMSDQSFGPTNYLEGTGPSIVTNSPDEFMRGAVQMKLAMGCIHFSAIEAQALTQWLTALTKSQTDLLSKFICKIHDVDRVSQIQGWAKSPLKTHLN